MNAAVDLAVPSPQATNRLQRMVAACARAWRRLSPRHWWAAAGIGGLCGVASALVKFLDILAFLRPGVWPGTLAVMMTRWTILMAGLACGLVFGLALLRDFAMRGPIRPRRVALITLAVIAWGAAIDPLAFGIAGVVHSSLRVPTEIFTAGVDWLTALTRIWTLSMDKIVTLVTMVTLSTVYVLKTSRTADALTTVQLRLAKARRGALAEELRAAQAALDPAFVFGTLAEVDRHFEREPHVARRLLDTLIQYLRAALPATDEAIGTLGQQAQLIRAYLDIETIRSDGRLQGHVQVPVELETRPFAPALILPLVAMAASAHCRSERDVRVQVRASVESGRLIVAVEEDGSEPGEYDGRKVTLGPLRQRVTMLYGNGAELSFAACRPRGSSTKMAIDDPGDL